MGEVGDVLDTDGGDSWSGGGEFGTESELGRAVGLGDVVGGVFEEEVP